MRRATAKKTLNLSVSGLAVIIAHYSCLCGALYIHAGELRGWLKVAPPVAWLMHRRALMKIYRVRCNVTFIPGRASPALSLFSRFYFYFFLPFNATTTSLRDKAPRRVLGRRLRAHSISRSRTGHENLMTARWWMEIERNQQPPRPARPIPVYEMFMKY